MSDADRYRRFAQECVELADQTENNEAKAKLLDMAEHWLKLAIETDAHGPNGKDFVS